ncbi:hypothetical protein [Planomonospora parontospora]|uniref:hypothetical protein n=1 Tax=Planomonospora parontospora TaxID=58119 RepID=UPI00167169CE|nr:hypothetical protein [Planomonospora parontospora]GGL14416.1 hypothetical protein GCM10014719_15540 [Planomonospora parontospora subsp. antibiotica]GII17830.1 hypothetical protein Ppa05_45560 [Planomonospora parontospora subsp. antibiotica]
MNGIGRPAALGALSLAAAFAFAAPSPVCPVSRVSPAHLAADGPAGSAPGAGPLPALGAGWQ